jgi:hypothetical protein
VTEERAETVHTSSPNGGATCAALRTWLARSAPQTSDGAYCGWLDARTRTHSFPYPEITGYLLSFAAYCGWKPEEVVGPDRAARWLVPILAGDRLTCRPDKADGLVYLFDLGMIAQGLLRYGMHTTNERLIKAGLDVVRTIRRWLPPTVATVRPVVSAQGVPSTWSTAGTLHLLKLLIPLLNAAEFGDDAAAETAHHLVTITQTTFDAGSPQTVVTCPDADVISLHAACYGAEGLWAYGMSQRHADTSDQAREITRWVWRNQLPGGGFPGFVTTSGSALGGSQSDVLAQAIRLAYLTGATVDGLDRAVGVLVESTAADGDGAAVIYRPGSTACHLNTWATMFAAQALGLHELRDQQFDWLNLV